MLEEAEPLVQERKENQLYFHGEVKEYEKFPVQWLHSGGMNQPLALDLKQSPI